jgi:hypothetical protein
MTCTVYDQINDLKSIIDRSVYITITAANCNVLRLHAQPLVHGKVNEVV